MGKKSTKTDKNIYFQIRDELNLTRAQAADLMETVSESRLEKIEYGDTDPQAEDILEMAQAYRRPDLINYYCAHECAIGRQSIPEVKLHSLSEITLKTLDSLNDLEKKKARAFLHEPVMSNVRLQLEYRHGALKLSCRFGQL